MAVRKKATGTAATAAEVPASGPEPAAPAKAEPAVTVKAKDFVERLVKASGAKKKTVKPILEAALRLLAEGLAKGEDLVLPPLGRLRMQRQGAEGAMTIKLRPAKARSETGAQDAEAGKASAKPARRKGKPAKQGLAGGGDSD